MGLGVKMEKLSVGIIGHAEDKFTSKTEEEAKKVIRELLSDENVVLVSGRCPISICDNCGKKSFSNTIDPIIGYVKCEYCGQKKKRRAGGIDIWAEEIADELHIQKQIFAPKDFSWNGEYGFKARNIDIAKSVDELHIIVVAEYPPAYNGRRFDYCYHCAKILGRNPRDHIKSGACYTGMRALEMGKRAEWHIIKCRSLGGTL